jgi:hypothetical protein
MPRKRSQKKQSDRPGFSNKKSHSMITKLVLWTWTKGLGYHPKHEAISYSAPGISGEETSGNAMRGTFPAHEHFQATGLFTTSHKSQSSHSHKHGTINVSTGLIFYLVCTILLQNTNQKATRSAVPRITPPAAPVYTKKNPFIHPPSMKSKEVANLLAAHPRHPRKTTSRNSPAK